LTRRPDQADIDMLGERRSGISTRSETRPPLGAFAYLFLDARYEKVRIDGVVRDAAILSAVGIGEDGKRSVPSLSVALSEAEIHWRARRENAPPERFRILLTLERLVAVRHGPRTDGGCPWRPLRGVEVIVSDDHSGLRAARRAVLGGATWQRCQSHLARNAVHHAPNAGSRKRIGRQLTSIWTADDPARAETALTELVASYRDTAPGLAKWLEENVPEGLAVFPLPEHHRKRMRTANPMERAVRQDLERRTVKVRVFPGDDALLRLVSAVLVEIDEEWASDTTACIKWQCQDA
jgi:transposase-like protein